MAAYREPWNSTWMGGSNTTHSSSAGFENRDRTAVAVEAALEPLPTWDGLAYTANYDDNYGRDPIAAETRRRQHDQAPYHLRERALNGLDLADSKLEGGEGKPYARDYAALRPSNLAGNPNVVEREPPRFVRRSESPEPHQERLSEDGATLTHVIRLHRTGSVEVERMRGSSTPEDTAGDPGGIGAGRRERELSYTRDAVGCGNGRPRSEPRAGYGYYAEEERFWQARCPMSTASSRETKCSPKKMASAVPCRTISGPTAIAHSPIPADKVRQSDKCCPGCGCVDASRKTHLEDSGDRRNEPRQPPTAADGFGADAADFRRKRPSTMPSGVLGCDVSGIGQVLPGGRDNGACRMADAAERPREHGDLLTSKGDAGSGSAAKGVRAGTGETTPPFSGVVPLVEDVSLTNCGGIANSSRLDGRYRAPEMPPPPPPPLPQPPPPSKREASSIPREVATPVNQTLPGDDARGLRPGRREHAGKRRVCSLQGVESTLQLVLDSMKGDLRGDATSLGVNNVFRENADNSSENTNHGFCHGNATTRAPPPSLPWTNTRNTQLGRRTRDGGHQQPATQRSHLSDAAGVGKAQDLEHALPISGNRDAGVAASSDKVHTAAGAGGFDCVGRHQSARRDRDGLFETLRTRGNRQQIEAENEEGGGEGEEEEEEEEAVTGRVIELSKGIALRCLHLEQECLRRGRTQARLFQEQLRGVRQAAQDMTRRAIRAERLGAKRRMEEAQKNFEETETALLAKGERAEESWKAERETLAASAAAAKSELDKVRRLSREEAEERRRDAEAALETQKLEFQRGWTEEKGRVRRAAEDALRRVEEGTARAEEEAALEARTAQCSLEAQVRSWKSKAEAAERRAAEERDKRRRLETGGKGPLAQETEKARKEQEAVLRDLRTKSGEERGAHAREIERLEEDHRGHVLRVHLEKKRVTEEGRWRWQQEAQELHAEAAAKAEEAATHAAAERAEALKRLRLAHDAEMRKAGRDVLRLERQLRLRQREHPEAGGVSRLKTDDSDASLLRRGSSSPKGLAPKTMMEAGGAHSCLAGVDDEQQPNRLSPGPSNVVGRAHPRGHSGGRPKDELQRDVAVSGGVVLHDSVDAPDGNFKKYVSLGSESSL